MASGMADDTEGFLKGPLDTLVPVLRKKTEREPALPVHPRIVHARSQNGQRSIVAASFARAAGARPLHAALKRLFEASLLAELSRPADQVAADDAPLSGLELFDFVPHGFDTRPALYPFALTPAPIDDAEAAPALALLRREAQLVAGDVPEEPCARHRARLVRSAHPLAAELARALTARAHKAPWGEQPGALAHLAAELLTSLGHPGVAPTRAGIERLEEVVVHHTPGVIRWIEPLLFQALCDLIALHAVGNAALEVEWAVCDVDPETFLAPPPLIRVAREGDSFHVPLGEHVLRWCVMPSAQGEQIPSLGAWAEHEFQ